MLNTLNHIAIIMDGNRRWAKKNELDQIVKGARALPPTGVPLLCGE